MHMYIHHPQTEKVKATCFNASHDVTRCWHAHMLPSVKKAAISTQKSYDSGNRL